MLAEERYNQYWPAIRTLRALREVPLPALADTLLGLMKDTKPEHREFRYQAIRAAGSFRNNAHGLSHLLRRQGVA